MKSSPISLLFTSVLAIVSAQLIVQLDHTQPLIDDILSAPMSRSASTQQDSNTATHITISETLASVKSINIFSGLTRDVDSVHSRLSSSHNSTILCPANSAMMALNRKPWQASLDDVQVYSGVDGQAKADSNLKQFVETHVVDASPWVEGQRVKTMAGGTLWWERKGDKKIVMPAGVEVEDVEKAVGNGEVWILKGTLNES